MDEVRRRTPTSGRCFRTVPTNFPCACDAPAERRHSTPARQDCGDASLQGSQSSLFSSIRMEGASRQWARASPALPSDSAFQPLSNSSELAASHPRSSTIQRQRRELQLLMAELRDRDKELNTMAASHHQQLQAWEQDRQKVLTLEQRCARLDEELRKRKEVIRLLTKRVWLMESREKEVQKELSAVQQQLAELEHKQHHVSQKCQEFEERNLSLNSTVTILSTQVGSLQVKEEELSTKLKLKDKDVGDASTQISNLSGRLRDLDSLLAESRSRESVLLKDLTENRRRHKEAREEVTQLTEQLRRQVMQGSSQHEDILLLKEELLQLRRDLDLTGEEESWKDELLELARSKQERTMSELRCLQQVCENQRNDLQLLQLNLESARENLRARTSQEGFSSQDELQCTFLDVRVKDAVGELSPLGDAVDMEHLSNGDGLLSGCFLQQLMEDSSSEQRCRGSPPGADRAASRGTPDTPRSPPAAQHPPNPAHPKPPAHQSAETPPTGRPRHCGTQTCAQPEPE